MAYGLVIASYNQPDLNALTAAFDHLDNFEIRGLALSGKEAFEAVSDSAANVLLTDLFLPDMDGLTLISMLDRQRGRDLPLIFAMSMITDDRLIRIVSDKIVYCFAKPIDPQLITLRMSEMLRAMRVTTPPQPTAVELMDRKISEYLLSLGVPVHLKGYYYLRDAIRQYALSASPVDLSITVDIYPAVARIYNTRPMLVEHAMRNAIEIAWTRGNLDTIIEFFGYTVNDHKGKPSNLEFVAMIAERLRMNFCTPARKR